MTIPAVWVLGIGNVLMGDDGFGPAVVRRFAQEYVVPPDIEVVDVGTPGLDLTPWLADAARVVIVDTVNAALPPGTMRVYDRTELLRYVPNARTGPHDPGLKEALLALEFAGRAPRDLSLIGVVPAVTRLSTEFSDPVRQALAPAVDLLATIVRQWGLRLDRRQDAQPSNPWWAIRPAVVEIS